jgi:hypothetical protein
MEREEIQISAEDLCNIVYDDHEDWEEVQSEVDGHWRHGTEHTGVFKRISDGKFFRMNWRQSPKDSMDFADMNYDCVATEVFPVKVTKTEYVHEHVKTASISFDNVKDSDGWFGLCSDLGYDAEDSNKCYEMFEYGEYGSFTIEVDKDFNIIGGKIYKSGK